MRDRRVAELDHTRSAAPIRRRLTHLLPAAGLLLAASGSAGAQSSGLYDTSRVLEHSGKECQGVVACKTVESAKKPIGAGRGAAITVTCPSSHPYVVGWDTEQNEHIVATLRRHPLDEAPASANAAAAATNGPDPRLVVAGTNNGPAVGYITVFVGCSSDQVWPTALLRHRSGVPANHTTFQGGSR
jgi:hypothetical protein